MKKLLKIFGVVIVLLLVGIQFKPVDRTNPPVTAEMPAPPEVRAVLRESCYDCHSNETRWPWYSYVAPASWFVTGHVKHARSNLNFSTWDKFDADEQAALIHEMWEEVEEGHMPLPSYLRVHEDAVLTSEDLDVIKAFSEAHGG